MHNCKSHVLTVVKHLQLAFVHPCLNNIEISSGKPRGSMDVDPVKNWIKFSNLGSASSKREYWLLTKKFLNSCQLKGCVRYIFTSLFCMSKTEHLWNKEKCLLFHFESSFHFWDNHILTFWIFKCHDVIKYPSMKHETHFIE